jgi:hypothetical protein
MTHRLAKIFLPVLAAGGLAASESLAANVNLSLRFRDSGGTQLAVRAGVFAGGIRQLPSNPEANIFQERGPASYFYTSGNVTISVPTGPVTIRAARGFEYQVLDTTVTVTSSKTLTFRLARLTNMQSLGWYSGDTHVHISHPPVVYALDGGDLALIARAEELNFINSMEEEEYFTSQLHPSSVADRLIYFSKEQRNAHFSHLTILGLKQWIFDAGCVEQGVACGRTLDQLVYAQVHAQSGEMAVIATHPFCTFDAFDVDGFPGVGMWRGMPIDLAAGTVDAVDLLSFWNAPPPAGIEPYFQALNAGIRIPPSAGTDCTLASGESGPPGAYRIFVDPEGAFTMDSWIAGLKAGRSFVTNYPLFTAFNVEGAKAGDVLVHDGSTLHGTVSVTCRLPFQRVEIWGDLGLLRVLTPPGGSAKSFTTSFDVARAGLTWVVARVAGTASGWHVVSAGGLFAQTAPVYLESSAAAQSYVTMASYTRGEAAAYFLERLDETVAVYDSLGFFPDVSRASFDLAVASARSFYEAIADAPTDVETPPLPAAFALRNAWPNPFGSEVHIDYTTPPNGGDHTVAIYDAAGRLVNELFSGRREAGDYQVDWDGRDARGRRVASGVYFVRVHTRDAAVGRKIVLVR